MEYLQINSFSKALCEICVFQNKLDITCNFFFLVLCGDHIDGIFRKLANGKGQDGLHALLKTVRIQKKLW